jgi:hypothetical protein
MAKSEKGNLDLGTLLLGAYLGLIAGMTLTMVLNGGQRRREKEKIRRHLERALDEVDDD